MCLDGVAQRSVCGLDQAKAYCRLSNIKLRLTPSMNAFKFGDGYRNSLRSMTFRIPIPNYSFLSIRIDIVDADIPLLIGLDILDSEKLVPDNVDNLLVSKFLGWSIPITRKRGHMFVTWKYSEALFTKAELTKLHMHFYHPSAKKLYNLVRRARPSGATPDTLQLLQSFSNNCKSCTINSAGPYRFRVSMPPDEIIFSHDVAIEVFWIEENDILHVVDVHTHYQNAVLLKGQSTEDIWDAFIEAWASVHVGYPNKLRVDHGSVFASAKWKQLTELHGIEIQISGVHSHNSIGVGERYHSPLRRVLSAIITALPDMDPEVSLRCAVKSINDTMGPEGLVPMNLFYGTFPSFPSMQTDLPTQRDLMNAIRIAREEMSTVATELLVYKALRAKLPPATRYHVEPGDSVLVYHEEPTSRGKREGTYVGPFKVVKVISKQVYVQRPDRVAQYNISSTFPDPVTTGDKEIQSFLEAIQRFKTPQRSSILITETLHPSDRRARSPMFYDAKEGELKGLLDRGVYEVVCREDLPVSANVLGGRFVLSIKHPRTDKELCKARFVVQGHTDAEKNLLVHNTTTLKQSSVRVIVAIAAIYGFHVWSQDVSQAYLQSSERLSLEIYVRPTAEFKLRSNQLLRLLKPLYGLSDSGDCWHATFPRHLKDDLSMIPSAGDLSLFVKKVDGTLHGLTGAYVDDSIGTGTPHFQQESELTARVFGSKPREIDQFTLAGIEIEPMEDGYLLHQQRFASQIKLLTTDCTFAQFRSKRHELAWFVNTRPDIAAPVNLAAQVTEQMWKREQVLGLNNVIRRVHVTAKRGIREHNLDLSTLSVLVFADSSFANASKLISQLGYIRCLTDESKRCNILHYSSYKIKRVVRSLMGGEIYAFADDFDHAYALRHDLETMLSRKLPLTILTDSQALFKVIVNSTTTSKRRLMSDIRAAREAYAASEISNVGWITSEMNPANGLTKSKPCLSLNNLLKTGICSGEVQQFVVRSPSHVQASDEF